MEKFCLCVYGPAHYKPSVANRRGKQFMLKKDDSYFKATGSVLIVCVHTVYEFYDLLYTGNENILPSGYKA